MKQSLTIKTGQQLAMTPALRQGIELLNLPSQEIEAKIQETLDSNIMLEEETLNDDASFEIEHENDVVYEEEGLVGDSVDLDASPMASPQEVERSAMIADDVPDSSDEEVYKEDWLHGSLEMGRDKQFDGSSENLGPSPVRENDAQNSTLRQHLLEQLSLVNLPHEYKIISIALIDSLNEDGFLYSSPEEIVETLLSGNKNSSQPKLENVNITDIEHVLTNIIHNFDPTGVGARSVQECLILQLSGLEASNEIREKALLCCREYFDLLGESKFDKLQENLEICDDQFTALLNLIRSLNPRPGAAYADHNIQYIVPDVYVFKVNGVWQVESNTSLCPALRINAQYERMAQKTKTESEKKTLQKHLSDAKSFINSLRLRNDTIFRVAKAIVSRQIDFFEEGESQMKPMILRDIAEVVGRDQSNVSRATSGKYMDTPRGIFEFKYFFNSHVRSAAGEDVSSLAIQNYIQKIVAEENDIRPYSDQKISNLLAEKGFTVARRTVTKYRELLSIPSSSQRKQRVAS